MSYHIWELRPWQGFPELNYPASAEPRLDGRKLAGVKRRLELLSEKEPMREAVRKADAQRIERLLEAEGYFRSLADGLRT